MATYDAHIRETNDWLYIQAYGHVFYTTHTYNCAFYNTHTHPFTHFSPPGWWQVVRVSAYGQEVMNKRETRILESVNLSYEYSEL